MKAVITGHGIMVKEMVKGFAIESANSGFFVVTCDFGGHRLSSGAIKSYLKLVPYKPINVSLLRVYSFLGASIRPPT